MSVLLLLLLAAHALGQDHSTLTARNCSLSVRLHPPLNMVQSYRVVQSPDMRCAITFVAPPPHHGLLVQVTELDTSPGPFDCEQGAVRLYSARDGQMSLLSTLCGRQNRSAASLTEGLAVLTFSSNHAASGTGFTVMVQLIGTYQEPVYMTSNLQLSPAPTPHLDYGYSQPDVPSRVYYHSQSPAKSFYQGTVQKTPYYQPDKTYYQTAQVQSNKGTVQKTPYYQLAQVQSTFYQPPDGVYTTPKPANSYYESPPLKTDLYFPSLPETYYDTNTVSPEKYDPPLYQTTKPQYQTTPKYGKVYYQQTTEPHYRQPSYTYQTGRHQQRIDYGTRPVQSYNQPAVVYNTGNYLCKECNDTYWLAGKERLPGLYGNVPATDAFY